MKPVLNLAIATLYLSYSITLLGQPTIDLRICDDPNSSPLTSWRNSSLLHITKILKEENSTIEIGVRRAVCNPTMPDTSCAAIPDSMFCRQAVLDRIQTASAWMATTFDRSGAESYENFRRQNPRPATSAFQYADGASSDAQMDSFIGLLKRHVGEKSNRPRHPGTNVKAVAEMQQRIVAYNMAALVGHEIYHMDNNQCGITEKAASEKSGIFSHVLDVQVGNSLFCPANPDPNEINADRCAMRHIDRLRGSAGLAPGSAEDFARRAAADMVAFQTTFGFRRYAQLPAGKYVTPDLDQYLRPPLRLLLLAGSMSKPGVGKQLCGEAAGLFVHGVQDDFGKCEGKGDVSDELLALLPSGVEASWNGAPWTEDTFSCDR